MDRNDSGHDGAPARRKWAGTDDEFERRRLAEQYAAGLPSAGGAPAVPASSGNAKHDAYIAMLEEKNRLRKIREAKQASRETEQREAGFSVYFRGGNTTSKADEDGSPTKATETGRTPSRIPRPKRKNWLQESIVIKGQEGEDVSIHRRKPDARGRIEPPQPAITPAAVLDETEIAVLEEGLHIDAPAEAVVDAPSDAVTSAAAPAPGAAASLSSTSSGASAPTPTSLGAPEAPADSLRRSIDLLNGSMRGGDFSVLEQVMRRARKLDKDKQAYLLQILDKLERAEATAVGSPDIYSSLNESLHHDLAEPEESPQPQDDGAAAEGGESFSTTFPTPRGEPLKITGLTDYPLPPATMPAGSGAVTAHETAAEVPPASSGPRREICLRILSTYGHQNSVGLSAIEVFDVTGVKIPLVESDVTVTGVSSAQHLIGRLVVGKPNRSTDSQMWLAHFKPPHLLAQVSVSVPAAVPLGALRVWNYNKSLQASIKCAKECEVWVDGVEVWTGSLDKGVGNTVFDYSTTIPLDGSDSEEGEPEEEGPIESHMIRQGSVDSLDGHAPEAPRAFAPTPVKTQAPAPEPEAQPPTVPALTLSSTPPKPSSLAATAEWDRHAGPNGEPLEDDDDLENGGYETLDVGVHAGDEDDDLMGEAEREALDMLRDELARDCTVVHGHANGGANGAPRVVVGPAPLRREGSKGGEDLMASWDKLTRFKANHRGRLSGTNSSDETERAHASRESTSAVVSPRMKPTDEELNGELAAAMQNGAVTTTTTTTTTTAAPMTVSPDASPAGPVPSQDVPVLAILPPTPGSPAALAAEAQGTVALPVVIIPSLPRGRRLTLTVYSTWGDQHYVGLSGIDVFDADGRLLTFSNPETQVTAFPEGISGDPRVPINLVDGVNRTCDDLHAWLTPFSVPVRNTVDLVFDAPDTVAMIRIWNYNTSRAHTTRGVRHCTLHLDGVPIFSGEIRRAPGILDQSEDYAECILFTQDTSLLTVIERNDLSLPVEEDAADDAPGGLSPLRLDDRPTTGERPPRRDDEEPQHQADEAVAASTESTTTASLVSEPAATVTTGPSPVAAAPFDLKPVAVPKSVVLKAPEPASMKDYMQELLAEIDDVTEGGAATTTGAGMRLGATQPVISETTRKRDDQERQNLLDDIEAELRELDSKRIKHKSTPNLPGAALATRAVLDKPHIVGGHVRGKVIDIEFLSNWGDAGYLGMTGIEVVDSVNLAVPLSAFQLVAVPHSINVLPNVSGDDRTADKLIDAERVTTDDHHMWLIPFQPGMRSHTLSINLGRDMSLSGLRVWNYNCTPEAAARGAKAVKICVDGKTVLPSTVLRKAPGNTLFDFGQWVPFIPPRPATAGATPPARLGLTVASRVLTQGYHTPILPCGLTLRVVLHSTWGDVHYLGLNGIEIYDAVGALIPVTAANYAVDPFSINGAGAPGSPEKEGAAAQVSPERKRKAGAVGAAAAGGDVRTGDKLFDGVNNTWDDTHMWLAPYRPSKPAVVMVYFDAPVVISMIKIWNYSKTPDRGVDDFEIYLDDSVVFQGQLRRAPSAPAPGLAAKSFGQSILFTEDEVTVNREKENLCKIGSDQPVVFTNDGRVVLAARARKATNTPGKEPRPSTRSGVPRAVSQRG